MHPRCQLDVPRRGGGKQPRDEDLKEFETPAEACWRASRCCEGTNTHTQKWQDPERPCPFFVSFAPLERDSPSLFAQVWAVRDAAEVRSTEANTKTFVSKSRVFPYGAGHAGQNPGTTWGPKRRRQRDQVRAGGRGSLAPPGGSWQPLQKLKQNQNSGSNP